MNWDKLKKEVELELGKRVQTKNDCAQLRISIYSKTGVLIGLNTLRRVFGLLPSNHAFRKDILNGLAKYIGYETIENYISNTKSEFESNTFSLPYLISLHIDQQLKELKSLKTEKLLVTLLSDLVLFHSTKSSFKKFLFFIFNHPKIWTTKWLRLERYQLIQLIGISFYNLNEAKQEEVLSLLKECEFLHEFFHHFPNQNNLPLFAKWVSKFYQDSESAGHAFKQLILAKQAFNEKSEREIAKVLTAFVYDDIKLLHPLLLGRYFELQILHKDSNSIHRFVTELIRAFHMIEEELELDLNRQLLLIYPFGALLRIGRSDLISQIMEELEWKHPLVSDFWIGNSNNHFKIFICAALIHQKKLEEARLLLSGINEKEFPRFESELQKEHLNVVQQLM